MENDKKGFIWKAEYTRIFANISGWIIGPILVSLFIGKYLDIKFDTAPWIVGTSLVISFIVSMIAIVRIAKKYDTDLSKQIGIRKEKDDNK